MSVTKIATILTAALLSGCAEYEISKLEDTKFEGKEFARNLAKEYEAYAKKESREYNDFVDATHFAVKGEQAATGLNVLPEDPRDWDIPDASLNDLLDGRERLTFALDHSGRADFVAPWAAKTQVAYDCWVQEIEEANIFSGRPEQLNRCKNLFDSSLRALEAAISKESPLFVIHFGENSSRISSKDQAILDNVAKISKQLDEHTVSITGHTDAQGGRKSNLTLSQNRAATVRDELMKRGIPASRLVAVGAGEVGGRQVAPKNRNVVIQIR